MILPIKLHTREGLMQLWSGVQHYPKQLQLQLKREIDRRNRLRHLGKPFTFIFLLCFNILASQNVVDTTKVYESSIFAMDESDDCSVRAMASLGYSYFDSHEALKEEGREDCTGVTLRTLLYALMRTGRVIEAVEVPMTNAKRFIDKSAEKGYSYLLFNTRHVFTIKEDSNGVFEVWGNPTDRYAIVLGYIKLSNSLKSRL